MAYRKAQGALRSWQHMRLGWSDVEGVQPSQGRPACILAKVAFAWVRNPVKIVYMDERRTMLQQLDEDGEARKTRGEALFDMMALWLKATRALPDPTPDTLYLHVAP